MNHSHLSDLQKRTKANLEQDKKKQEQALTLKIRESLKDLEQKLHTCTTSVVNTIESDTQKFNQAMNNHMKLLTKSSMKTFIFNLVLSLSLILGLFLGSLGIAKFTSSQLMSKQAQINLLKQEITDKEKTLAELQTLGLELVQTTIQKGVTEQFIILPTGMKGVLGFSNGNRNVIKLVKE